MVKKESASKTVLEIKKASEKGMVLMGLKEAIKALNEGKAQKIFYAMNLKDEGKEDLISRCTLLNVELEELDIKNIDLGVVIKKPFSVGVVTIIKD